MVSLVNPQAGAAIGDMDSVAITINENDDINGVFSFDSVLVSTKYSCVHFQHFTYCFCLSLCVQILLPESEGPDDTSGVATLTVLRLRSTVGEVTVYWEVAQDGVMDLQPTGGNLTFRDVRIAHTHTQQTHAQHVHIHGHTHTTYTATSLDMCCIIFVG